MCGPHSSEGLVARSVVAFADRRWVNASLLSSRLGLTSQLPTGTPKNPPLCTTSTPWAQTSTCRPSGLWARSSRTMTRKHRALLPHPCLQLFPWLPKKLLGCICLDPGLSDSLRMLFTINIGMEEERLGTGFLLSPHCCCGEEGALAEVKHPLLGAGALSLLLFTVRAVTPDCLIPQTS